MESWSFAHRHLGRMLVPLGIVSAIASVTVVLTARANPYFTLLAVEGAQLLALGCTCLETELALRKNFDGDGHPMNHHDKV